MQKLKIKLILIGIVLSCNISQAQLTDGMTGLLHMVTAEVQKDGTFMLGGNMLHKKNIPSPQWWITNTGHYNTYNYFLNITLFDRIEVSYICTLIKGRPIWPSYTWGKFTNQDRHFAGKIQLVKEGEWWKHMPAIAVGVSDPTTSAQADGYYYGGTSGSGNGFFNRWFAAMSKHVQLKGIGEIGVHATYLYNQRTDYPLNSLGWGINFRPNIHRNLNLMVEHDTKTLNVGALYSLWADHFNFLFELQDGKYVSCGFTYKVNLKGGNQWKSNILKY